MEKEDNSSKRKNFSPWFDQKYSIDRRSQVLPAVKKTNKIFQQEALAIPFQDQVTEDARQESPVVAQEIVSPKLENDDDNYMEEISSSVSIAASSLDTDKTSFKETLEKILFNPTELNKLKKTIQDLNIGITKPSQLKKLILESYIRIFEELGEFIPSYLEYKLNYKSIDAHIGEEVQEKDKLLEELGERINNIYLKLKKKAEDHANNNENLEVKNHFKPLLEKINEIDEDAQLAYESERYKEYIRLKYLSLEKRIELLYYKVFNNFIPIRAKMKIFDNINEIETRLNVKFGMKNELKRWKKIRNLIVHDYNKVQKKQAQLSKLFFNKLSNKLNTAFYNC